MAVSELDTGPNGLVPKVVYVFVEIPKGSQNKYEIDEKTGLVFLDRALFTTNIYPGDYGYIPRTKAEDGDSVDCLVLVSYPNYPAIVLRVRPIALIKMIDEKGRDDKIVAVPDDQIDPRFSNIRDLKDLSPHQVAEIKHFFEHMKELEPGKWVKVERFEDSDKAMSYIKECMKRHGRK